MILITGVCYVKGRSSWVESSDNSCLQEGLIGAYLLNVDVLDDIALGLCISVVRSKFVIDLLRQL